MITPVNHSVQSLVPPDGRSLLNLPLLPVTVVKIPIVAMPRQSVPASSTSASPSQNLATTAVASATAPKKRQRQTLSEEQLEKIKAIMPAILEKKISMVKAAERCGIKRATFVDRFHRMRKTEKPAEEQEKTAAGTLIQLGGGGGGDGKMAVVPIASASALIAPEAHAAEQVKKSQAAAAVALSLPVSAPAPQSASASACASSQSSNAVAAIPEAPVNPMKAAPSAKEIALLKYELLRHLDGATSVSNVAIVARLRAITQLDELRTLIADIPSSVLPNALSFVRTCCPNIESIDFSCCSEISEEAMRELLQFTKLRRLIFTKKHGADAKPLSTEEMNFVLQRFSEPRQAPTKENYRTKEEYLQALLQYNSEKKKTIELFKSATHKVALAEKCVVPHCFLEIVSQLRGVTSLSIDWEGIAPEDVPFLIQMTWLEELLLQGSCTDETLKIVGELTNLRQFTAKEGMITDKGLLALSALKNLTHLALRGENRISDRGVEGCKNLTALDLHLSGSTITNKGFETLVRQNPRLTELSLDSLPSPVTETALHSLEWLRWLERLELPLCPQVTDDLVRKVICRLTSLTVLDLSGTTITDNGFSWINKLRKLSNLSLLLCTKITGVALLYIAQLRNLKNLDLSWCNGITNDYLDMLVELQKLETLFLDGCEKLTEAEILLLENSLSKRKFPLAIFTSPTISNDAKELLYTLSGKKVMLFRSAEKNVSDEYTDLLGSVLGLQRDV